MACHDQDDPAHNGCFSFSCSECGEASPLTFKCSAARRSWADSHTELTGHVRYGLSDTPCTSHDYKGMAVTPVPTSYSVPEGHRLALVLRRDETEADLFRCSCGATVETGDLRHNRSGQRALDDAHAHIKEKETV